MDATVLAALNDAERMLVAETEPGNLSGLSEDGAIGLEDRIRRSRNKYVSQYRRGAAAEVAEQGGRGKARPQNTRARLKAEAFEEALARVSRRVAVLARRSAAELKSHRLAAARAVRQGRGPGGQKAIPAPRPGGPAKTGRPAGSRTVRSPRTERQRAETLSQGARRQAKKDSR